ncbi:plastocyanin/azurin family copper-binding protein [Cytobacillus firmus]|uniref:Plastocyanin/azurin family copper-binding protein n=1 Tax=Cytobacillus firmus TaxID=1399 RepID=A0AA46SLZ7_CYTFI|nr:plastocyanin/azurin family copper-binding protein [Cytobacillus firmus]UYG97794.1 plastocyanin/azurin family copper-binding protein [Cytobacillus firmus]
MTANHGTAQADFHLHSSGKSEAALTFTSGVYDFYCSIPGYKENGMIGTITVD